MLEPGTWGKLHLCRMTVSPFSYLQLPFLQVPHTSGLSPKCPEPAGRWIWGLSAPHLAALWRNLLCCKPLCLSVWLAAHSENKSGSVNSLILSTSFSFNKVIKIIDGLWNSDLKRWKRCQSPVMENIHFGVRQTSAKTLSLASANCVFFIYRFLTLLFCKLEMFCFVRLF